MLIIFIRSEQPFHISNFKYEAGGVLFLGSEETATWTGSVDEEVTWTRSADEEATWARSYLT